MVRRKYKPNRDPDTPGTNPQAAGEKKHKGQTATCAFHFLAEQEGFEPSEGY